jgi:hypothetical protein
LNEVNAGDRHSSKIAANKAGLLKGATIKRDRRAIGEAEFLEIAAVIEGAGPGDFRPLLYVIPYRAVADIAREVPVRERAHVLSEEFIIEDLRSGLFDVLELPI